MSYMRGRFYVWSDGERMHLWVRDHTDNDKRAVRDAEYGPAGISMPMDVFDELVRFRMAREDFKP